MKWLTRYRAHPDPAIQAANTVALVVGSNGPFYPLYVWWLLPEAGLVSLLTMLATPLFLAVPWVARRWPAAGPAMLVLVGAANTVWCTALLGRDTGVGLFVLPCLVLPALAPRGRLVLLAIGLLAQQLVLRWPWASLAGLPEVQQNALFILNASSGGTLLAFLALQFGGLWHGMRRRHTP